MKKAFLLMMIALSIITVKSQIPHLVEHEYPYINEENPEIRALMESITIDNLTADINHLTSYRTRRFDSKTVYEAQDWLFQQFKEMNIDTVFLHDFPIDKNGVTETSDNVIAIQLGVEHPDEFVVCGAHYDSWCNSEGDPDTIYAPGADDNATGVAGILETAKALSKCTFERSIIYCNFAAEEVGLFGSAAFAADCAAYPIDILGYFNMDMNGYLEEGSDIHVHLMYVSQDSTLANYFYNFSDVYFPDVPVSQHWLAHGDSDYSSFNRNGYAAIHPFEDVYHHSPYTHTRQDVMGPSVNNMEQSKIFAQMNLVAVATLAGLVNTSVEESQAAKIELYPNPADTEIHLKGEVSDCQIFDVYGKEIFSSHENTNIINVSDFPDGMYFLMTKNDGSVSASSFKFIVKH